MFSIHFFMVLFSTLSIQIFHIDCFQNKIVIRNRFGNIKNFAKKISENEWNLIKESIENNKEAWQEALNTKRQQFKSLKDTNAISKLTEKSIVTEEQINEIDKILGNKPSIEDSDVVNDQESDDTNDEDYDISDIFRAGNPESAKSSKDAVIAIGTLKYLQSKYDLLLSNITRTASTAVALTSLLNEIKDKKVYNTTLIENIIKSIIKLKSPAPIISAFKTYYKLAYTDQLIEPSDAFLINIVNSCYINNLLETGDKLASILIEDERAVMDNFFVGKLCLEIQNSKTSGNIENFTDNNSSSTFNKLIMYDYHIVPKEALTDTMLSEKCQQMLLTFYQTIKSFSITDINTILRVLGRSHQIQEMFKLLQIMKSTTSVPSILPNEETYEFLCGSLVTNVNELASATSMKDLPQADINQPEIVFAGRSNVGKSSLVNFLVNRKTLASTSATPGHTTQFHFFNINQDRSVYLPHFRLVDVPGLGYAETGNAPGDTSGTQDSWRSLLDRYISVREPLAAVFHLIDSRHKITSTDTLLIELMKRASIERIQTGKLPALYIIVLTKVDKATAKELTNTRQAVMNIYNTIGSVPINIEKSNNDPSTVTSDNNINNNKKNNIKHNTSNNINIIETSSTEKIGREQLWQIILKVLEERKNQLLSK